MDELFDAFQANPEEDYAYGSCSHPLFEQLSGLRQYHPFQRAQSAEIR